MSGDLHPPDVTGMSASEELVSCRAYVRCFFAPETRLVAVYRAGIAPSPGAGYSSWKPEVKQCSGVPAKGISASPSLGLVCTGLAHE